MNKAKQKTVTTDVDTPQMKEMRQAVVEQELSARSWRAYYEKMYFSLEAEKLEPLYKEYQERSRKRIEEETQKREEFMKKLQEEMDKQNEANPNGELKLEEVESGS